MRLTLDAHVRVEAACYSSCVISVTLGVERQSGSPRISAADSLANSQLRTWHTEGNDLASCAVTKA